MKIVRLEQDRIKVILSDRDLMDMNINTETLYPDSPQLGAFVKGIMEIVEEETGFSAQNDQVVIEAAADSGGMVLILSKIRKRSSKTQQHIVQKNNIIFEFDEFSDLAEFLLNIKMRYLKGMRLYRYKDAFYVAVPRHNIPIVIYEYSFKNKGSAIAESILYEHGQLIADKISLLKMVISLKKLK